MNKDILVGQVEEVQLYDEWDVAGYCWEHVRFNISSRWYRLHNTVTEKREDTGEYNVLRLSSDDALIPLEELVASDDFTELVPVN